jgi:hypothetical protein
VAHGEDRPPLTFTADLITNAATAVLDAVGQEWVRTDGRADRAALLDHGFAALRPTVHRLRGR